MIRALAWIGKGRWRRLLMAAAVLVVVSARPVAAGPGAGNEEFPVSVGGPFTLIDHTGRARTDRDFRGRFLLVYFGYTKCPDICIAGLETVSAALDLVGEKAMRVQPLFVSVDPARDRSANLTRFIKQFHPRLVGLTGSESQIRDVARAYRVYRAKVVLPDMPKDEYLVTHTPNTYLMGPDGKFVTLFPHDTDPEAMAKTLARYLAGAPPS